jgi:hypothetical protein
MPSMKNSTMKSSVVSPGTPLPFPSSRAPDTPRALADTFTHPSAGVSNGAILNSMPSVAHT